jgi:hypothetical protein
MKFLAILLVSVGLIACASTLVKDDYPSTSSLTADEYAKDRSSMGVVLLGASWERTWNCGGYENAELRSIGFDLLPTQHIGDQQPPDLIINGSASGQGFMNYAFPVKPGKYALSYVQIKVAKSVSDVGYLKTARSVLLEGGNSKGGTFDVAAGEVVYIGHFGLDCAHAPILWRYYTEDRKDFGEFYESYRLHYPYLDLNNVQYRLFKTKEFGYDFNLP